MADSDHISGCAGHVIAATDCVCGDADCTSLDPDHIIDYGSAGWLTSVLIPHAVRWGERWAAQPKAFSRSQ